MEPLEVSYRISGCDIRSLYYSKARKGSGQNALDNFVAREYLPPSSGDLHVVRNLKNQGFELRQ